MWDKNKKSQFIFKNVKVRLFEIKLKQKIYIQGPFGLNLLLLKLKTENTVAK